MSVNTPILQQILSELVGLRQDVTELKTDVAVLKTDVAVLKKDVAVLKTDVAVLKKDVAVLKKDVAKLKEDHSKLRFEFNEFRDNVLQYTKSQTLIQEKTDTLHIYELLRSNLPTLNIEIHSFGNFYRQNDKQWITDIDGCITIDSFPRKPNTSQYTRNNSLQFKQNHYRNEIMFLESKTQLDKGLLDKKLRQFAEIYTIVSNITKYNTGVDEFMSMITTSPLNKQPTRIYFMLVAEDMAISMRQLIHHINNATLTEKIYKDLVYSLFKEIPMFAFLKKGITDIDLKNKYLTASTFDEYVALFSNSAFDFHRAYLDSFFTPYKSIATLYAKFKGILGYSFQTLILFPSSFSYSL